MDKERLQELAGIQLNEEDRVKVGAGVARKPEVIVASVKEGLQKIAAAVDAGKWKYAESLLKHTLQQVSALEGGKQQAPDLEKKANI